MAGAELSNDQLMTSFIIKEYVIKNYPDVKVDNYNALQLWNEVLNATDKAVIEAKTKVIFDTEGVNY